MITQGGSIYYVPLTTPHVDHQERPSADPRQLPLRTHGHFLRTHDKINAATTSRQREAIGFQYGIRHFPLISRVSSIDFAVSFPWEWMHLFSENVVQHIVSLTSGRFKGMNTGNGNYELDERSGERSATRQLRLPKISPHRTFASLVTSSKIDHTTPPSHGHSGLCTLHQSFSKTDFRTTNITNISARSARS